MRERGIVTELAVLIAGNAIDFTDRGEHFGLLDGVDAEVGFEIKIQIEHVLRVSGFLDHQREDAFLHGIA